jgi:hypothetical protein
MIRDALDVIVIVACLWHGLCFRAGLRVGGVVSTNNPPVGPG